MIFLYNVSSATAAFLIHLRTQSNVCNMPHSPIHFVFYTSAPYLTSTHNRTLMREQLVPCYRQKTFTLKTK